MRSATAQNMQMTGCCSFCSYAVCFAAVLAENTQKIPENRRGSHNKLIIIIIIIIIITGMIVLDLHVLLMSINLHLSLTNPLRELPLFVVAAFPPKPTTNAVIIALFPPRVNKIIELEMNKAITDNQVKPA